MVKLIMGHKGMGKTKTLIDMANKAVLEEHGNVVVIELGTKLTYDISHKARLVDISRYDFKKYNEFYAFICGMLESNYDITAIFIDSILKICEGEMEEFETFLSNVSEISEKSGINIVITASGEQNSVSKEVAKYFIEF